MSAGVILLCTLFTSALNAYQKKGELGQLEKQKNTLNEEKTSLEQEIQLLHDTDYATRYAREHYVFTGDGERVTIIPSQNK